MRSAQAEPPEGPSSERFAAIAGEQQRWRHTLLEVLARLVAFAGWVSAAFFIAQPRLLGHLSRDYLAVALLASLALIKRVGLRQRALLLVGCVYVACILATVGTGFLPNASLGLCAAAVIATLLLGVRVGVAFLLSSGVSLAVVARLFATRTIVLPVGWEAGFDIGRPAIAARVILMFCVLTAVLVAGVHYAVSRAEAMLLAKSLALQALEREIAEKERIKAELKARDEMVRRAAEMEVLGRLAGFAAHDVNNALLVIQASIDMAREDLTHSPQVVEVLDTIGDAADTAAATMRQLRAFGRGTGAPGPQSVRVQLGKVTRLLRHLLPPSVEVRTELEHDATIRANESEFQRVVLNLALNARDAMPNGGVLSVRTQRPALAAGMVTIEVCDTGSGMDAATLAKVFEPFFTTKGAGGTGLGLASVREVVQAHGGEISVQSALGAGTTFSMRWPLFSPSALTASTRVAAQSERQTVLLVDDDPVTRRTVARMLEMSGCAVLDAADGNQALLAARRHRGAVDALLTDCMMPGMPVRQLIASFRKAHPAARVIMSSGHAPDDVATQGLAIDVFLPKPFGRAELMLALGTPAVTERGVLA